MEDPITGMVCENGSYICPNKDCKNPLETVESNSGIIGYYCMKCDDCFNKEVIESW